MLFRTSLIALLLFATSARQEQRSVSSALTRAEAEQFLLTANITSQRVLPTGVIRLALDDGKRKHDALASIVGSEAPGEDIRLNLAAYELDKALNLYLVPTVVERNVNGKPAVLSWFVDDLNMAELERRRRKIDPPNAERWTRQMQAVRFFDELISNSYRNIDPELYLSTLWDNLLITKDWKIWITDYKRAFRSSPKLDHPETLIQCDQSVLRNLRVLDKNTLQRKLGKYLSPEQLNALEIRRQLLVKYFDERIARYGETAVVYDLTPDR
jgi:hypothetical protein